MAKVEKQPDGCWIWMGAVDKDGYPMFQLEQRKTVRGTRWLMGEVRGEPVPRGVFVCHSCDVPGCVNPAHLFLGSALANNQDRDSKGRGAVKERHYAARLTAADVERIRSLARQGLTRRQIAEQYGVSKSHVTNIVNGLRWSL